MGSDENREIFSLEKEEIIALLSRITTDYCPVLFIYFMVKIAVKHKKQL
jgi:hypothetical protein